MPVSHHSHCQPPWPNPALTKLPDVCPKVSAPVNRGRLNLVNYSTVVVVVVHGNNTTQIGCDLIKSVSHRPRQGGLARQQWGMIGPTTKNGLQQQQRNNNNNIVDNLFFFCCCCCRANPSRKCSFELNLKFVVVNL